MVEHFIHYNGKDYTPLEFSEMISNELPEKARGYLLQLAESLAKEPEHIKMSDELIEGRKKLVENDKQNRKMHEEVLQLLIKAREDKIQWFNRDLQHFYLVLATLPLSDELSRIVKAEVDSLK